MQSNTLTTLTYAVFLTVLLGSIFVVAKGIVVPIFIAAIVAYVLVHAANRLSHVPGLRWCPVWSLRLMILVIFAVIVVVFFGVVVSTAQELLRRLPAYQSNVETLIQQAFAILGRSGDINWEGIYEATVGQINLRNIVLSFLSSLTSAGGSIFLILIYALFLMSERGNFVKKIYAATTSTEQAEKVIGVVSEINDQIANYLATKTAINVILGLISFVILFALGVDFALFWAILIALLNYIPYVGSMLGVAVPVVLSVAQFGSLQASALVLALLLAAQLWVGNFLEPRLIGKQLNMSPLIVLLSLSVFSGLWGVAGAILAVPLTSIIAIVLGAFDETRFLAVLLAENVDEDTATV
ncbi:AI-2E family transporter [Aliiroseovarius sp. 2305UL8-7]|uniref:AI-2E family transporter n=1 Tax=Aliiroseovarius conchicola TaxID=3121637 RepID=UPI003528FB8C